MPYRGMSRLHGKLQDGVSLHSQVDLISKGDPLLSVPMLRGVLLWQASLSRQPLADALLRLVNDCCEWLLGHFERFITDRVRPVEETDTCGRLSSGRV